MFQPKNFRYLPKLIFAWVVVAGLGNGSFGQSIPTLTEDEADRFFVEEVKPILAKNCWECHAEDPKELGGNLALTSRNSLLKGGESGPAVDPNSPLTSLIVKAINYDVLEMPPDDKLSKPQIETLTKWIQLGMPWPESEQREVAVVSEKKSLLTEEAKRWWSFQKPIETQPPTVTNKAWCTNGVDQFILKKLEDDHFEPAPPASKVSLIRRAYYDLIGLPPTFEEVQKFVGDPDPKAYEKLIDRLLDSPHYGEKWGRHWLDLVRYAESNSFERDGTKPFVWRYRDYVIQSVNHDKPYDQFIIEQLAGDEIPNRSAETIIATGYYRLGQWDDEPADPELARFDSLDDILATTSQTLLGLTVNCARCHDHKIDPILQSDYYKMLSFFNNIRHYGVRSHESVLQSSVVTVDKAEFKESNLLLEQEIDDTQAQINSIEENVKKDFIPVEHEEFRNPGRRKELVQKRVGKVITQEEFDAYVSLNNRLRELRQKLADQKLDILCVKENGKDPIETHIMIRGNPHITGERVEPGFVSVLSPPAPDITVAPDSNSSGRRLALAKWIASKDNPLTARVMANRIWQFHMGRGIVRTSSDFGFQGSKPTHPELLDWLATQFVKNEFRMKPMHRLIMLSSTYQMASSHRQDYYEKDPENDHFWHFNLRRLQAEEIRDSILATTGQLNLDKMFGRSVYPELPKEVLAGQSMPGDGWEKSPLVDQNRRSIYIHLKRSLRVPILSNFDAPEPDFTCPVRFVTTQPTQALNMINSDFIQNQAAKFAESLGDTESQEFSAVVGQILSRVVQRSPTDSEIDRGVELIKTWIGEDKLSRSEAIQNFCLLALNLNEFVYLD